MPVTNYKVWGWGKPLGIGVTGASEVGIAGVAKKGTLTEPHIVANEVVCNALAHSLLLPCPPGATLDKAGETWFFSLDFNVAGHSLPPIIAGDIVADFPRLSWGIILFDSLVLNHDRHDRNISHDTSTNVVQIFDHSHAFIRTTGDVSATLAYSADKLCIGAHCLATEICDTDGMDNWLDRISQIPDYFIEGIVDQAAFVGLPPDKSDECKRFLKHRRSNLRTIVQANMASFPKLPRVTP